MRPKRATSVTATLVRSYVRLSAVRVLNSITVLISSWQRASVFGWWATKWTPVLLQQQPLTTSSKVKRKTVMVMKISLMGLTLSISVVRASWTFDSDVLGMLLKRTTKVA